MFLLSPFKQGRSSQDFNFCTKKQEIFQFLPLLLKNQAVPQSFAAGMGTSCGEKKL